MRCATVKKELLTYAIDRKDQGLPAGHQSHIDQCSSCRQAWDRLQRWAALLQKEDQWQPSEDFYRDIAAAAMHEKQRAALTESTRRDLFLDTSGFFSFLHMPLNRWAYMTIFLLVFMVPGLYWGYDSYDTIGQCDFVDGQVLRHSDTLAEIAKTDTIHRGDTIQTALESRSIVHLEGHSEVLVGARSRLVFIGPRTVKLELGRAYFDIHPGRKDFEVLTPNGEVMVLGTAFAVEVEARQTRVTVTRGVVQVSSQDQKAKVTSGRESVLARQAPPVLRDAQRIQSTIRWVENLREERNEEELRMYYPSLAAPERRERTP